MTLVTRTSAATLVTFILFARFRWLHKESEGRLEQPTKPKLLNLPKLVITFIDDLVAQLNS